MRPTSKVRPPMAMPETIDQLRDELEVTWDQLLVAESVLREGIERLSDAHRTLKQHIQERNALLPRPATATSRAAAGTI